MARSPKKEDPPATGPETPVKAPARSAAGEAAVEVRGKTPSDTATAAADADTALPPSPPPAPPSQPVPAQLTPPAALSFDDVMLIRDRIEAFPPGTAAGPSPTDQLVALMADRLASARAADSARIAILEAELARLVEQAATTNDDRDVALRDALGTIDALLAELVRVRANDEVHATDLATASDQRDKAQREVAELRLATNPKATGAHVLGAETVASLLNDFVGSFGSRIDGLQVSSGDVLLKAGFAQLGQGAGFVLPTASAPAGDQPVLHDIRLRLDPKS